MRILSHPATRRAAIRGVVLIASGGSLLAAGFSAAPAIAATPACRSSQLVTWLDTSGNGAAGTVFYALNFTNIGTTCTLKGFPGVSAVGQTGRQLGAAAGREDTAGVKSITLKGTAGGDPSSASTARATLGIVEAGNFPPSACHETTASGLRVFAPNQSSASFVAYPFAACSLKGRSFMSITAVKR